MSDRFDRFTERARKALQLAQEESQRFNHNYIGTEHILLGLVREADGVAAHVLNSLGIELHKVRAATEFIIGRGDKTIVGSIGLTPRAKRVIELAVDEAHRFNHHHIGTEHLLLGLIRESEGIASGVLESLGVQLEMVRARVIQVLKSNLPVASMNEWQTQSPTAYAYGDPNAKDIAVGHIRLMFDYSLWARNKLLGAIETLTEEQRQDAQHKGVYGSIHDTLAHMAVSEWLWLRRCKGESPLDLPKGSQFPGIANIVEWWDGVHAEMMEYLAGLHPAHLSWDVTYDAPDGKRRTRRIGHMLLHVTNHQTEHRAQLGTMLGTLGVEVPATDLVVYLSELAEKE